MRGFLKFLLLVVVAFSVAMIVRSTRPKPAPATVPMPDRTYSRAAFDSVTWAAGIRLDLREVPWTGRPRRRWLRH